MLNTKSDPLASLPSSAEIARRIFLNAESNRILRSLHKVVRRAEQRQLRDSQSDTERDSE